MSGRILSHRLVPLLRTGHLARHVHNAAARTGGLLRSDGSAALRRRPWPVGANAIHNVPAVRAISFHRILPKLALKLVRLPAMFGGAVLAGAAYIQYQAAREFFSTLVTCWWLTDVLWVCFRGGKLCYRYLQTGGRNGGRCGLEFIPGDSEHGGADAARVAEDDGGC